MNRSNFYSTTNPESFYCRIMLPKAVKIKDALIVTKGAMKSMGMLAYQEEIWEELLDGRVVAMSPRPAVNHNVVAENIIRIFGNYLEGKPCRVFGEIDVYLTEKDRVIPDAIIVCNNDIIRKNGVYGAPDLIVEVLSPGTAAKDKGYKRKLYEKCGVREYWLVDTDSCSIEVHLLHEGRFELDDVYSVYPDYLLEKMTEEEKNNITYTFKTSLFSDMSIELEKVFQGML